MPFVGWRGGPDFRGRGGVGRDGMGIAEGGGEAFGVDAVHAPGAPPEGVQVEAGADLFDGELGEGAAGVAGGVEGFGEDLGVLPAEGFQAGVGAQGGGGFAFEEVAEIVAAQEAL